MATKQTKEIQDVGGNAKPTKTSFWKFATNEASRFYLDDKNNVNVILFKKIRFIAKVGANCDEANFEVEISDLKRNLNKLIKMFRIQDAEIQYPEPNETIASGKMLVMTYIMPAIDGVNKVLENFYSLAHEQMYNTFKLDVRVTDLVKITYDNSTLNDADVYIRGYLAATMFPQVETASGKTFDMKTYLRSDCAVSGTIGFDSKDVFKFNKYNSTFNKVRFFYGGEKGREVSTVIPFRGKLSLVSYKAVDLNKDESVRFERNIVNISYIYNKGEDKKSITSYGPNGIRVSTESDIVDTKNMVDLFYKDGVNLVTTAFLGISENEYPEWRVFKNELEAFDETFLSALSIDDDEEPAEAVVTESTESTEETVETTEESTAEETAEVAVEATEEVIVEEKAAKKTRKSKKAKAEETAEAAVVTEEPTEE